MTPLEAELAELGDDADLECKKAWARWLYGEHALGVVLTSSPERAYSAGFNDGVWYRRKREIKDKEAMK